jgi:adenylate cyclase
MTKNKPVRGLLEGATLAQAERRLSAIMLADIAGYSTLMEREESRTFARLQSLREQTVNPKVAEFGGRVIKTTGDGFLAEFPSPTAALGCGITIQRLNFAQESTRDEAERFHLRIGINLGDIIIDGDDVSGDGVNIAARLEPLAPPDGLCVSGAVRDQVREDLGVVLEDLGDQQVKNISRPIRAYRINLANAPLAKPTRAKDNSGKTWIAALASIGLVVFIALAGLLYWRQTNKTSTPP